MINPKICRPGPTGLYAGYAPACTFDTLVYFITVKSQFLKTKWEKEIGSNYKDEQLVSVNGSGYIVQNFTTADEGEYTCKCSNVAGEDMANITLVLYGK